MATTDAALPIVGSALEPGTHQRATANKTHEINRSVWGLRQTPDMQIGFGLWWLFSLLLCVGDALRNPALFVEKRSNTHNKNDSTRARAIVSLIESTNWFGFYSP